MCEGSEKTVTGLVRDVDDLPIKAHLAFQRQGAQSEEVNTDEQGTFSIRLSTGQYEVVVSESGTEIARQQITVLNETGALALSQIKRPYDPWPRRDIARVRELAEAGNTRAQAELGNRYRYGLYGASQDYSEALSWYKKALAQGSPDA